MASRNAAPRHSGQVHREQKKHGKRPVACVVITVSDTRDLATDTSGRLIERLLRRAGHKVINRAIVRDEVASIRRVIRGALRTRGVGLVVLTGGTGIAHRDVTIEAVLPLLEKELPGFGELFRSLSYREIGSAAFLSRATAGIAARRLLVCLPGSPGAVRLAVRKLLLPELPHVAGLLER